MERKRASDFPQELLNLLDEYVHGQISRRKFLDRARKFAVGGVTATGLFQMLRPNYAWAMQVSRMTLALRRQRDTVPSPRGNGSINGYLARPANVAKAPSILVIHENRGLNPYIEDVARRLAIANFIAFAPDGLTSVGGYPGDDEKGAALFKQVDGAKMMEDFVAAALWLKSRPDGVGKLGALGFCFGGGVVNKLAVRLGSDLSAAVPFYGVQPSEADVAKITAPITPNTPNWTHVSPVDGRRSTPVSRRRKFPMRVISTKAPITAFTTTRRHVTTKPRPTRRGDIRWIGSTHI